MCMFLGFFVWVFFTYCTHLNLFLRGSAEALKSLYLSDLARCCELARQYKAKDNNCIQRCFTVSDTRLPAHKSSAERVMIKYGNSFTDPSFLKRMPSVVKTYIKKKFKTFFHIFYI